MMAATDFSAAAIPTCQNLGMAARALLGAAAQQHHAGTGGQQHHADTGGQQQDRVHGERHRRGTRLAQAARLGGIHLAVRARLDRRLLRAGLLAINLHQSLPGGLQRGKRVSHLGGSRVLVGGDLLRSVEGGLELVRAGLALVLGQLLGGGDRVVQRGLVGGLDAHFEGLGVLGVLERHRERGLADLRERLRVIHNGTIGVNRGNPTAKRPESLSSCDWA